MIQKLNHHPTLLIAHYALPIDRQGDFEERLPCESMRNVKWAMGNENEACAYKSSCRSTKCAPNVRQTSVCRGLICKPLGRTRRTYLSNSDKLKFVGHWATPDLCADFN